MNNVEFSTQPLKIVIADSHEFSRIGLRFAFQQNPVYRIIAEASDADELLHQMDRHQPDIVVMDIQLVGQINTALAKQIKCQSPEIKLVVLMQNHQTDDIGEALSTGADAYCLQSINAEQLMHVLDAIRLGAVWFDPAIAKKATESFSTSPLHSMGKSNLHRNHYKFELTQRESEVLQLLTEGNSNKEIAMSLRISTHTVKTHVRNLIQKLAVDDRTQAAIKALQTGLVRQNQGEVLSETL